jgi:hypothetical protein
MGVNEEGVVACLTNRYAAGSEPGGEPGGRHHVSRGAVVPQVLAAGTAEEAEGRARRLDFASFRPFTLMLFSLRAPTRVVSWPGGGKPRQTLFGEEWFMLTSSSWRGPAVCRWRRRQFDLWRKGGEPFLGHLPAFHLLQPPGMAQWAPLMDRRDTHTRSITQVEQSLAEGTLVMRYWRNPAPGSHPPDKVVEIRQTAANSGPRARGR